MIRLLPALLLIPLMILSAAALAQDGSGPIGTIITVEGTGNIIMPAAQPGQANPASADQPVFMNDVIQTAAGGKILVMLLDETRFTLGENSLMKIDEYIYDDEKPAGNRAIYSILQGVFLYTSGLIAKDNPQPDVRIKTPYGAIGIRGTTVWGGTIDDEYSVFVDDGDITFETNRGRIRVMKGEGTTIRNINTIPERAKIWGTPKIDRAKTAITLRDPDRVKDRVTFHKQEHMAAIKRHKTDIQQRRKDRIDELNTQPKQRRIDLKELQKTPVAPRPAEKRTDTPPPGRREAVQQRLLEGRDKKLGNAPAEPAFPAMEVPPAPADLPDDPAKRQEAIEQLQIKTKKPDPL